MNIDVLDLRLFLHVVEQGSITRGAELTHLSLTSASGRIAALERLTGTELVQRHRRGVTPTRRGELLRAHAREIVGRYDRMRLELADFAGGHGATVTVLVNTAAATLLPGMVVDVLARHPEMDVELIERPSHRIVAALAEGRAELGVLAGTVDLGRLETVPLVADPLVVVVHPSHHLAGRDAVAFTDVVDEPFVGLAENSPLQEHLRSHAAPLGTHPRHRARFPDTASVRLAVAAGVGIAVLPARNVGDGLVGVRLLDDWANRELLLATRRWSDLSGPARELTDGILQSRVAGVPQR